MRSARLIVLVCTVGREDDCPSLVVGRRRDAFATTALDPLAAFAQCDDHRPPAPVRRADTTPVIAIAW